MTRYDDGDPSQGPSCDRCTTSLAEGQWARLAADFRGKLPDYFRTVEKRLCLDCVAALGLLESADSPPDATDESNDAGRLARLRFR